MELKLGQCYKIAGTECIIKLTEFLTKEDYRLKFNNHDTGYAYRVILGNIIEYLEVDVGYSAFGIGSDMSTKLIEFPAGNRPLWRLLKGVENA